MSEKKKLFVARQKKNAKRPMLFQRVIYWYVVEKAPSRFPNTLKRMKVKTSTVNWTVVFFLSQNP